MFCTTRCLRWLVDYKTNHNNLFIVAVSIGIGIGIGIGMIPPKTPNFKQWMP